jgi:ABC-type Fe3+/spermidine/putrescine transport system ATPase subunit
VSPISVDRLAFRRGAQDILSDVSLSIDAAEVVGLLGPSGSGKSTLLRIVLGLAAPDRGLVRLDGEVVSADGRILRPPEERGLAIVFQDLALWPHLTVRGNLAFGLAAKHLPADEQNERIARVLQRVSLQGKENRHPADLSGGERQRVAIARALVLEPRAVLLDEPLSNLDVPLKRELLNLLKEILRERRVTTVFVTHDLREAMQLAERFAVLEAGRISQAGTLDELLANPATPFVRALREDVDRHRSDTAAS